MSEYDLISLCLIMAGIFLIGGVVKGFLGQGLPTTTIALLSFFVSPLEAIGLNYLPMLCLNAWQFFKADNKMDIISGYHRLAATLLIVICLFSFFAVSVGNVGISVIIGVVIILFSALSLIGFELKIRDGYDGIWQVGAGAMAGIIGGLTSLWGSPLIMYLLTRPLTPKQFVDVSGFLLLVGCLPLAAGYYVTGVFSPATMLLPAIMGIIAGLVGFQIGARLRDKVRPNFFKKLVLILFMLMGIRMLILPLFS